MSKIACRFCNKTLDSWNRVGKRNVSGHLMLVEHIMAEHFSAWIEIALFIEKGTTKELSSLKKEAELYENFVIFFGKTAVTLGESFRLHEGLELMEAYENLEFHLNRLRGDLSKS